MRPYQAFLSPSCELLTRNCMLYPHQLVQFHRFKVRPQSMLWLWWRGLQLRLPCEMWERRVRGWGVPKRDHLRRPKLVHELGWHTSHRRIFALHCQGICWRSVHAAALLHQTELCRPTNNNTTFLRSHRWCWKPTQGANDVKVVHTLRIRLYLYDKKN